MNGFAQGVDLDGSGTNGFERREVRDKRLDLGLREVGEDLFLRFL